MKRRWLLSISVSISGWLVSGGIPCIAYAVWSRCSDMESPGPIKWNKRMFCVDACSSRVSLRGYFLIHQSLLYFLTPFGISWVSWICFYLSLWPRVNNWIRHVSVQWVFVLYAYWSLGLFYPNIVFELLTLFN